MSYTTNRQPQGIPFYFTNKIREAMIAELVAINDYTNSIASNDIKDINEVFYHIMEEEKEHYGMFLSLLRKYDPEQYRAYEEVKSHLELPEKVKEVGIEPKHSKENVLNFIRENIKGELEAIVLYEQHLVEVPYKDIKETFRKVINDEKEHSEELTALLMHYDKDKYGPIEES